MARVCGNGPGRQGVNTGVRLWTGAD